MRSNKEERREKSPKKGTITHMCENSRLSIAWSLDRNYEIYTGLRVIGAASLRLQQYFYRGWEW
jgi:hypothetical protein